MKKILVINGPNLNMTGIREPEIYGSETLDDINLKIKKRADELGAEVSFFQSNYEGAIIDEIHKSHNVYDGIILNPGAYSHYSLAIADALRSVSVKSIEVHMSNVFAREGERHNLTTAPASVGMICGFGAYSYILALEGILNG